jgi:hypothetical protein
MKATHIRRPIDSPQARERLLQYVAAGDTLDDAIARVGITRSTVMRWRRADPEFDAAIDAAYAASTDVLEKEARARALDRKDGASAGLLKYLITGRRERWCKRPNGTVPEAAGAPNEPELDDFELARRITFLLDMGAQQEKKEES